MSQMVILDRDGVINHDSEDFIKSPDEWIPIKGSIEAISRLKKADYLVTVATNQSGIARGLYDEKKLGKIHDKFEQQLSQRGAAIDGIFYCPHGPSDNCICRKPKPGLLLQIAKQFNIKLSETIFVGDTITDIKAARLAGAIPVLVKTGNGEATIEKFGPFEEIPVYDNLSHFVREFLRKHGN